MTESKFEKQLKALISTEEVNKDLDGLEDSEEQIHDMTPVIFEQKATNVQLSDNRDLADDYQFARSNLYGLIGRSNAAIELSLKIAAMSEHPKAMEVAASIMKTSADMTKQLLDLQRVIKDSTNNTPKGSKQPEGHYEQHNHYYGPDKKDSKQIDGELDGLDDSE